MTTHERIIDHFNRFHYATSSQLVEIAGYRYGARLGELRKKGYEFDWGYRHNAQGKKLKSTIYVMRKNGTE